MDRTENLIALVGTEMEYTIRKEKKRGETYPRGVLVRYGGESYTLETMAIRETANGAWVVNFAFDRWAEPLATFPTLDEAARWTMRGLDFHANRSEA